MLLSRDELVSALFGETDRAQRMKTGLATILFEVEGWEDWGTRLDRTMLEEVERELTARTVRLLRCYDVIGRYRDGVFGLVLPGCNSFNAVGMAERLTLAVFSDAVRAGEEDLTLSACFGVAGSGGRSPLVVLRNAENALSNARLRGPGSIERSSYDAEPDPATMLIPVIEDGVLHW
jgi:GGDEF domain-containing protein